MVTSQGVKFIYILLDTWTNFIELRFQIKKEGRKKEKEISLFNIIKWKQNYKREIFLKEIPSQDKLSSKMKSS